MGKVAGRTESNLIKEAEVLAAMSQEEQVKLGLELIEKDPCIRKAYEAGRALRTERYRKFLKQVKGEKK